MMAKLIQRYPTAQTVILTADDEKKLLSESLSNIDFVIFDDFSEGAIITPESERRARDILMNLLESSKISIEKEKDIMWDSVFWNDENYRPDKVARTLNDIYKKLDGSQKSSLSAYFSDKSSMKLDVNFLYKIFGLGVNTNLDRETGGNYSQEEFIRLINESKETVIWEGEKFVPKQMSLSRINFSNLRNKKIFQERIFKISYNTTFISMDVNIKQNLGKEFVDEIFRVHNELKGTNRG